jgi:hypothetical protein
MPFAKYKRKTLLNNKSLAEYYVVFGRSMVSLPFIERDYSHCYILKWDGFQWIMLNPAMGYTDMFILTCYEPDVRAALAGAEYTDIIHVSAWRDIGRWRTALPVFFTCVEQVKAFLGIRAWWILTPKQLYKYLRGKHGCNIK